jgi:hypothetical protein
LFLARGLNHSYDMAVGARSRDGQVSAKKQDQTLACARNKA